MTMYNQIFEGLNMHCTSPLSFKARPGFVVIKLQSHFLGLLVQTGMTLTRLKSLHKIQIIVLIRMKLNCLCKLYVTKITAG